MGKKKTRRTLFSTLVEQINEKDTKTSSNEYHLVENEYFAAFNTLEDIQKFHTKLNEKQQEQSSTTDDNDDLNFEHDNYDMDMKSFAQQYLIDLPEQMTKLNENLNRSSSSSHQETSYTDHSASLISRTKAKTNTQPSSDNNKKRKLTTPVKRKSNMNVKKNRKDDRNSSQSSFLSNNSSANIFDSLQNEIALESMNSTFSTYSDKQSINNESTLSTESSAIKSEPIDSEQFIVETKQEPIEVNVPTTGPMTFGTLACTSVLDDYVQNIHLIQPTIVNKETNSTLSSRPKRIRKRKIFYIEESEEITRKKRVKLPIKKKRLQTHVSSSHSLTDAEIEKQFGERLPSIKVEGNNDIVQHEIHLSQLDDEHESNIQSSKTPLEKARAKLTTALRRGHQPDTYLLKIRSREHKIIEVQLAIYATADWHSNRTKILSKIEEALRGLRVSWTKIDIRVDDFDVQISTSSQAVTTSQLPTAPSSSANSTWFLKTLSESGALIVHIHDRRYPQQRFLIQCSCSECSPTFDQQSFKSSLPINVNVSPTKTIAQNRRLTTPSILNKTQSNAVSTLHNIDTMFFNQLIQESGKSIVVSVTQCVLDLALITSVYSSLSNLYLSQNCSDEDFKKKYQQIIDPLKYRKNENDTSSTSKISTSQRTVTSNSNSNNLQPLILPTPPDILSFYKSIKKNQANIRDTKSMRQLILSLFPTNNHSLSSPPALNQGNIIKARTLILPKTTTSMSLVDFKMLNEQKHRSHIRSSQTSASINERTSQKQHTPIIEIKSIGNRSIVPTPDKDDSQKQLTNISDVNQNEKQIHEVSQPMSHSARVIRLSIAKSALTSNTPQTITSNSTIRIVTSSKTESLPNFSTPLVNTGETVPLVPKQINIIKPLSSTSSSITPAIKLSNPILISTKPNQPSTK